MAHCIHCGSADAGVFCARCGQPQADTMRVAELRSRLDKRHAFPAFMSFLMPGLGQLIKGQTGRGALVFLGFWGGIAAFTFVGASGGEPSVVAIGFLLAPIAWIWNVYDAYKMPE